jgi:hypothetical protein
MGLSGLLVDAQSPNTAALATSPMTVEAMDEIFGLATTASHASACTSLFSSTFALISTLQWQTVVYSIPYENVPNQQAFTGLVVPRKEVSITQERERWLQKDIEKLEGSGISQPLQETKESNQERSKLAILTNVITPKPDLHS